MTMTFRAGTVALNIVFEGLFVDGLIDNDEKEASSKKSKNHTLYMTKTAEKPSPFGTACSCMAHITEQKKAIDTLKLFFLISQLQLFIKRILFKERVLFHHVVLFLVPWSIV